MALIKFLLGIGVTLFVLILVAIPIATVCAFVFDWCGPAQIILTASTCGEVILGIGILYTILEEEI